MAGARRVVPLAFFGSTFLLMSLVYVYGSLGPAAGEFLRYLSSVLYYGAASVLFLSLLGYGAVLFRRATRVDGYDPVPVETALEADDTVEIKGVARGMRGTLEAEFSGKEVLAHDWEKVRKKRGGTDTTLDSGREAVPFYLEDGTGRVAVDTADADLRLGEETVEDDEVFRRVERRIEPGDEVCVRGSKRSLSSDGGGGGGDGEAAAVYIGEVTQNGGADLCVSDGIEQRRAKRTMARACLAVFVGVLTVVGSVTPPNLGLF
jgi:hypothetical protein